MNDAGVIDPPSAVVMVRPHHFSVNQETAADNSFQQPGLREDAAKAYDELTAAAQALREAGVTVHLFDDEGEETPDSVFPNNWFSTHEDGRIALYPMRAPSRRGERRRDIIDALGELYRVEEVIDFSPAEQQGHFLEGTGSIVFDRPSRIAFAALSPRTDASLFEQFCDRFDYRPVMFTALGGDGTPIYHTNVMMTVGTGYALVGVDSIAAGDRKRVLAALQEGGHEIIALSQQQLEQFAGNAFELAGRERNVLALSSTAWAALNDDQRRAISMYARALPLDIPTIEKSGGSVRCTIAGVHLHPRV